MKYFYSFISSGFYNSTHSNIPEDAIELKSGDYKKLLTGLEDENQIINVDGYPELAACEPQSPLEKSRYELNFRLSCAEQQIAIIKPAVDGGYAKPEHTQLLADWQRCRYELTLVPVQAGWPESPQWPAEPDKVI